MHRLKFVFLILLILSLPATALAATIYVDASNTTGTEDGTSANPYNTIQEGFNAATISGGDTISVAAGTYNSESWPIAIAGKSPLTLTGSGSSSCFIDSTGETSAQTVDVDSSDNFTMSGFQITADPNTGADALNIDSSSSISLSDLKFIAGSDGNPDTLHLVICDNATVDSCIIDGSNVPGAGATGIHVANSANVTVSNCIAYTVDAAFLSLVSGATDNSVTYINCVAYNCNVTGGSFNTGFMAADVAGGGGVPTMTITNSIASGCETGIRDISSSVFGQTDIAVITSTYNCLLNTDDYGTSASAGTGDLEATDPRFISTTSGAENFRLQSLNRGYSYDSPCIDAGTSSGAPSTDFAGLARPQGAGFDMGAYGGLEYKCL